MVAVDPSTATGRAILVFRMVKSHLSFGLKPYWKPESNGIELIADFTLTPIISYSRAVKQRGCLLSFYRTQRESPVGLGSCQSQLEPIGQK